MDYLEDIWTHIISFNKSGEIREIKLITYTQGTIILTNQKDIDQFISCFKFKSTR